MTDEQIQELAEKWSKKFWDDYSHNNTILKKELK